MANSHNDMFHGVLEGNKYDPAPVMSDEEIREKAEAIRDGKVCLLYTSDAADE